MNTKVARTAIIIAFIVLVFFAVYPVLKERKRSGDEYVVQETLQCIVAVCVDDRRVGRECEYLTPTVSRVMVTVADQNPKHRKIVIVPTEAECK